MTAAYTPTTPPPTPRSPRPLVRRTTRVVRAGVLIAAAGSASISHADDLAWASDAANNLWRINFTAGSASLIGNTGVFIQDLAYSPTGVLSGTTITGQLYNLDTQTGLATWVGSTGLGDVEGLDWVGQDLIATNFSTTPAFYELNPFTGEATWLRQANFATGRIRSMEALDLHTLIARGDSDGGTLFRINLDTGAVTTIGSMPAMIAGLEYIGTRMYGVGDDGQLYRVNATNGVVTQIGDVGTQYFTGLASIPTPGAAGLLALGSAVAVRRRR